MTWRRHLKLATMVTFLVLFFTLVYLQKNEVSRVLVVHSYNTDYDWVNQIDEGVARVFNEHPHVQVRSHYMDLKNHTDDNFRRTATNLAERIVDEWQPEVLILFDDVAQRLIGEQYAALGNNGVPMLDVVFGGVNGNPATYYGDSQNVAGILERKPLSAIKETLAALVLAENPSADLSTMRPRIQFIGDTSLSITAELPFYDTLDWAPMQWLDPVRAATFDDWKGAVERAGQTADLILLTNYQQIRDGADGPFLRPAAQVMQWTQANATIPVLGVGWNNSQDGAMLTVSVSPFEQGDIAAELTLDILNGTPPAKIGVKEPKQFMVHICAPAMAARNLQLPSFFEAFARATDNYHQDGC